MPLRFEVLGSSSSGNCAFIQTADAKVLIDAGFSGRRIGGLLESIGESPDTLDAVFLTHEHSDHIAGVKGLSRRADLPFYATAGTAKVVQDKLKRRAHWKVFEAGASFRFRDLQILSFRLPHDAIDPVGFLFETGTQDDLFNPPKSLAWVTDLGYIPQNVAQRVAQAQLLVLESNHDVDMLDRDERRPWSLKQRIKGRHGHLSNEAAHQFISQTSNARWEHVMLAHLSAACNDVARVAELFVDCARLGREITVIDPEAACPARCIL